MALWGLFQVCKTGLSFEHQQKYNYMSFSIDAEKTFDSKKKKRKKK